jgi:type III pantothenate kinase
VGANAIYPDSNVLIVDFGTAITMDVVTREGEFAGGNISPGVEMRLRALHDYTARLPLCVNPLKEDDMLPALLGVTTEQAICNGVVGGIIYEIEGFVSRIEERYEGLKIIFTGGDAKYFAGKLKNTIFATCDLVAYGLNRILEYGDQD